MNTNFDQIKKNSQNTFNYAINDWNRFGIRNNEEPDLFSEYLKAHEFINQSLGNRILNKVYLNTAIDKVYDIIQELDGKWVDKKDFKRIYRKVLPYFHILVLPFEQLTLEEQRELANVIF